MWYLLIIVSGERIWKYKMHILSYGIHQKKILIIYVMTWKKDSCKK